MSKYYLAYGSNLNLAQMKRRCPTATPVGTAFIDDYRLMFKGSKSGSYLTIEKAKGYKVPVGVWKIEDSDEHALDIYEGYPTFYYKEEFEIEFISIKRKLKHHVKALVYIMDEKRMLGLPSEHYVLTCLEGYKSFGFDAQYLKEALKYTMEEKGNDRKQN